jgi:phage-related tail fiber protein
MADFSKPALTDTYTSWQSTLTGNLTAALRWLDPATSGTHSNIPSGAYRLNAGTLETYSSGTWTAATLKATQLTAARTIAATGDVAWSVSFDGSSNVTASASLSTTGVSPGTYRSVTVDAKGRVTAGSNPTTLSGYGITDAVATSGDQSIAGVKTFTGTLADSAGHVRDLALNTQNANYTLALSDRGKCIIKTDGGTYTWTIPTNATVALPVGAMITVRCANSSGSVTIARASGVALRKAGSGTDANVTLAAWGMATLLKEGTDSWVISGTGVS